MPLGTIKSLETFTDQNVCFVKATSSDGHIGWGQTSTYNADITAQILHRQVAPWVLGQDASDIGALITRVEDKEHKFPGSYRCRALAGLDTALWDMRGKVEGKPVVELLGGKVQKLRARQVMQLSFRATPSMQREIFLATNVCHTVARSAVTNTTSEDRVACGNIGSL